MSRENNANGVRLGNILKELAEDNAVDKSMFFRILDAVLRSIGIRNG